MPAAAENVTPRRVRARERGPGKVVKERGRVHIRLEKPVLEQLEQRARDVDMTPAALARNLIASGLHAMPPRGKRKRGSRTPSA